MRRWCIFGYGGGCVKECMSLSLCNLSLHSLWGVRDTVERERRGRDAKLRELRWRKGMSSWRFGNTIPILMRVALRRTFLVFRGVSLLITDLIAVASSAIRFSRWHFTPTLQVSSSDRYSPMSLMIIRQNR